MPTLAPLTLLLQTLGEPATTSSMSTTKLNARWRGYVSLTAAQTPKLITSDNRLIGRRATAILALQLIAHAHPLVFVKEFAFLLLAPGVQGVLILDMLAVRVALNFLQLTIAISGGTQHLQFLERAQTGSSETWLTTIQLILWVQEATTIPTCFANRDQQTVESTVQDRTWTK